MQKSVDTLPIAHVYSESSLAKGSFIDEHAFSPILNSIKKTKLQLFGLDLGALLHFEKRVKTTEGN